MSDIRVSDGQISRRRVVQGALWAAPAIAIATAIPAAAVSTDPGTMQFLPGYSLDRVGVQPRHYVLSDLALQHLDGLVISAMTITVSSTVNLLRPPVFSGTGWSLVSGASLSTFVFAYGGTIAAGASTPLLDVDFTRDNNGNGAAVFTVTATGSTNGGTNNVSASIPGPINFPQ